MTKGWVQSLSTGKQYLVSKWNEMKMHFEDNFLFAIYKLFQIQMKYIVKVSLSDVCSLWIGMYIAY